MLQPNAFADSEEQIVRVYQAGARKDEQANPDGATWFMSVPPLPEQRPCSHTLVMRNAKINYSYCFRSQPSRYNANGVHIKNFVFTDSDSSEVVDYTIETKPSAEKEWKRCFWQECSWRNLELNEANGITRKYNVQKMRPSSHKEFESLAARTFESLCERDEKRLAKHLAKAKRVRRHAALEADAESTNE